jgi:phosphoenolpyruvate phosphomutase
MSERIWNFIFANQSIRTVVSALSENLHTLRASADLMSVEGRIASVEKIFRLQGADELCRAERKDFDPTRR